MATKKKAKSYDSGTLAAFGVIGALLIALGVLSLLSVIGGLRGTFFTQVKRVMQGLGGGLCIGVSVLLIWGGLLVAFSAGRSMPKRGILAVSVLFLAVLAIINLLSKVGYDGLMDYAVARNLKAVPPIANADGYWQLISTGYELSAASGAFGGALGMLLAWPTWTFMGTVISVVILVILCIACVLLCSHFDIAALFGNMGEAAGDWRTRREEKRAQREQQRMLEEQEHQREEAERLRLSPAYTRRGKEGETAQPAAAPGQQPVMPPYGSMLQMPPNYGFAPMQQVVPVQPEPELYDEIIVPDNKPLPWKRGDSKKGKKPLPVPPPPAIQTSMTFTPSEMGVSEEPASGTVILSASKKRTLERLEEIRRRKAMLDQEIEGAQQARQAEVFVVEDEPEEAPVAQPVPPAEPTQPLQPIEPDPEIEVVRDPHAAYKRPPKAKQQPKPSFFPDEPEEEAEMPLPKYPLKEQQTVQEQPKPERKPYVYPSIDLLSTSQCKVVDTRDQDTQNATKLEKTLDSFGIPARVQRVTHGPAVTRFELGLVSSGINVKRIMSIADNIALDMAANGGVRIEIPIPGTNLFGIEVPNKEIQSVSLSEVLLSPEMQQVKSPLAVALGRDIAGKPIICDLEKMPHLLIAGQTGSGKSVCINAIVNSLLFRSSPEEVRMIMIDPKVVELQCYNVVPHLLIPVVSDPHKAAGALAWAVAEMLDRYHKIQSKNVRNLAGYNAKVPKEERMPRIVIIIDELADLMLACKKEVEESIIRIAQLARAAGIHMVVATQRPTVDVITGLIKANIPSRIAFAVSSSIDSRTILDQNGAEKLLGRGDMFYAPTGLKSPLRVQGCFLSDAETERVVDYIGKHSQAEFDPNIIEALESDDSTATPLDDGGEESGADDRLSEAIEMVISDGQASISMLQRRMKIGYARAGRLIDDMAARGIVSKSAGSKPREVLITREEYDQMKDQLG